MSEHSINDVMQKKGGGGLPVCMTSNDEGCIKKQDRGERGSKKIPQNSMTPFIDSPLGVIQPGAETYNIIIIVDV